MTAELFANKFSGIVVNAEQPWKVRENLVTSGLLANSFSGMAVKAETTLRRSVQSQ